MSSNDPVFDDADSTGTFGEIGATVSMVTSSEIDRTDVLAAMSVAVAVSECTPSARAVLTVNVHAPAPLAVVVPSSAAPS